MWLTAGTRRDINVDDIKGLNCNLGLNGIRKKRINEKGQRRKGKGQREGTENYGIKA